MQLDPTNSQLLGFFSVLLLVFFFLILILENFWKTNRDTTVYHVSSPANVA